MEDLKFKDVAGHYIGSKVLRPDGKTMLDIGGITGGLLIHFEDMSNRETYSDCSNVKPILFPLSAMTDEQCKEWDNKFRYFSEGTSDRYIEERLYVIRDRFVNIQDLSPEKFLWALRNHFNVFNLPESEYIDASKLPVNPYLKP